MRKIRLDREMLDDLMRFAVDEDGATAIEYGLIACLVSVAGLSALSAVGANLRDLFNLVATSIAPPTP